MPVRAGYEFEGWYIDQDYFDEFNFDLDSINEDTTLYAKWSIMPYNIEFVLNNGEENYIFYNGGVDSTGIEITISKDANIPIGLFTPYANAKIIVKCYMYYNKC